MWLVVAAHQTNAIDKRPHVTASTERIWIGSQEPFLRTSQKLVVATAMIANPTVRRSTNHHSIKTMVRARITGAGLLQLKFRALN